MANTAIGQSNDTAQPRQVANGGGSIRDHLMQEFGLMLDRAHSSAVASAPKTPTVASGVKPELLERVTRCELRVLERLALGEANKVIAYEIGVSEATVKSHIRKISTRFGATNRTQLALMLVGALPVPSEVRW